MNSLQSFNSVANDSWENNPLAPFFKGEYYASFFKTEFANSIIPVPPHEKPRLTYATLCNSSQLFHILAGQECPAYRVNSFLRLSAKV
jgi:hypothetical protein